MSNLDLLIQARDALIEGRPEDALAAITQFHDLGSGLDSVLAPRARQLLEELERLAEAGCAGVAAARQGLIGAIDLASGVGTYDRSGRHARAETDRRKPMRF